MDCRGFVEGGCGMGARKAGPAKDIRRFVEGFLIVEGMGIPDLALARGSIADCMTDRRRESIARPDGVDSKTDLQPLIVP